MNEETHVFHHTQEPVPEVRLKLIRNTKGYQWEITTAAATLEEAHQQLVKAQRLLDAQYPREEGGA